MKTKVTKQHLKKHGACSDGYKYWIKVDKPDLGEFIRHCIKDKDNKETEDNPLNYANWLIVRCMSREQYIQYSIYAAKQCLSEFERHFPDDKRPREAIEAAAKALKCNMAENRSAAASAAWSAARSAARSAAESSESAARSAAESAMQIKILRYGMRIMKQQS